MSVFMEGVAKATNLVLVSAGGHRLSWVVEEEVLGLGWAFREKKGEKLCFSR